MGKRLGVNSMLEVKELYFRHKGEKRDILKGLTVVMTLHDPNLASLFSDKIVVINSGNKITEGSPKEVLTEELIKRVYGIDVVRVSYNGKNIIYPNL